MRCLLICPLLLSFSIALFGQKELETRYDKFKDETNVQLSLRLPKGNSKPQGFLKYVARLDFILSFSYPSQTLKSDVETFYFFFSDVCQSYYCFSRDPELIFLVDGKRFALADPRSASAGIRSDTAMFSVTRDELKQLATAKILEAQIDATEFRWEPKQIALLKTALDRATVK